MANENRTPLRTLKMNRKVIVAKVISNRGFNAETVDYLRSLWGLSYESIRLMVREIEVIWLKDKEELIRQQAPLFYLRLEQYYLASKNKGDALDKMAKVYGFYSPTEQKVSGSMSIDPQIAAATKDLIET